MFQQFSQRKLANETGNRESLSDRVIGMSTEFAGDRSESVALVESLNQKSALALRVRLPTQVASNIERLTSSEEHHSEFLVRTIARFFQIVHASSNGSVLRIDHAGLGRSSHQ